MARANQRVLFSGSEPGHVELRVLIGGHAPGLLWISPSTPKTLAVARYQGRIVQSRISGSEMDTEIPFVLDAPSVLRRISRGFWIGRWCVHPVGRRDVMDGLPGFLVIARGYQRHTNG